VHLSDAAIRAAQHKHTRAACFFDPQNQGLSWELQRRGGALLHIHKVPSCKPMQARLMIPAANQFVPARITVLGNAQIVTSNDGVALRKLSSLQQAMGGDFLHLRGVEI
jgi:hypothetical protein